MTLLEETAVSTTVKHMIQTTIKGLEPSVSPKQITRTVVAPRKALVAYQLVPRMIFLLNLQNRWKALGTVAGKMLLAAVTAS